MDNFEAVNTKAENHVAGWVTTTDNTRIWVEIYGQGRPIILLHGWTTSSVFWKRQLTLADTYQIITIDMRGHGNSPATLRGNTIARYARDVRDVLRSLNVHATCLTGWSMGGSIVLEYWKQYGADRVSSICLIENTPHPLSQAGWNTHPLRGGDDQAVEAHLKEMTSDRKNFGSRFIHSMFMAGKAPSHAFNWMINEHMKINSHTASEIYIDYAQRDLTSVLPTMTLPTLIAYGRSQHKCYGPSTGRFVAGASPCSRLTIMEHSGHIPFYEEADTFNQELASFITTAQ